MWQDFTCFDSFQTVFYCPKTIQKHFRVKDIESKISMRDFRVKDIESKISMREKGQSILKF